MTSACCGAQSWAAPRSGHPPLPKQYQHIKKLFHLQGLLGQDRLNGSLSSTAADYVMFIHEACCDHKRFVVTAKRISH